MFLTQDYIPNIFEHMADINSVQQQVRSIERGVKGIERRIGTLESERSRTDFLGLRVEVK